MLIVGRENIPLLDAFFQGFGIAATPAEASMPPRQGRRYPAGTLGDQG